MFSNIPNISVNVGNAALVLSTLSPLEEVPTNCISPLDEPKLPLNAFAKLKNAPSVPLGLPVIVWL